MKNSGASFLSVLLSHNDFPNAEISNLSPVEYPEGIFKTVSPDNTACVESGIYHSPFPFNEMLMSANVVFRNKGYFTLEAQILSEDGWSGWLSFGRYSHSSGESGSAAENEKNIQAQKKGIFTDTDILKTEKKASAMRFRIRIKADEVAVLRLVSFTFTDTSIEYTPYSGRPERLTTGIIDSEPVSQLALPSERATRICSPVCCSTAMRTAGINVSPLELEQKSHDNTADICGNWFLNTACAGAYGAYAFVTRLNSPEEAKSFLDLGIPISASLTFGENELPGFYLKKTAGHFMLLRGFNEKGDAVVNDPAVPSDDEAAKTYPFKPFEKAWLKTKKGLCYIITDKPSLLFRVSVPVVSLYRKPPSSGTEKEKEELIETQLLYNESVELVCTEGKWAQIRSLEQRGETACGTRLLPHYEGWLEYSALRCAVPVPPVKIINCKKKTFENIITGSVADIHAGKQTLSIGTGVPEENICSAGDMPGNSSEDGLGTAFVVSSSGRQGFPAELRKHILKKAEYFLGDPYVWGGRSADGVDCSGLVNISYRACGIDLPRNAHGQFLVTAPLEPAELQPADLMFFSDTNIPDKIGHVMLYMGGGMLIEATQTTNNVRIVSCDEKTGVPFSRLTNGLVLPSGRSFHCGTIFTSDFLKDGILREPGNRVIKNIPEKTRLKNNIMPKNKTAGIISALKKSYPDADCALEHRNVFELLVATILSAQCTDERVNKTTPALFSRYPDAAAMAQAPLEDIEKLIKPTGFYHNKALSLKEASKRITEVFGGIIPRDKEKLMTLRGVAGKTANVVLGSGYGIASGIVVDTHVKRLAFRLGLTQETDPVKIEAVLVKKIPQKDWIWFSHALILHGRGPCNARKPDCAGCSLNLLCPRKGIK